MNYSILHIEGLLENLHKTLKPVEYLQNGYNNLEYQLNIENRKIFDNVVKKIISYRIPCREALKVQKIENAKFQNDLDVTALIIQLLMEIDKYVTSNTPEILIEKSKLDLANITLEKYSNLAEGVKFFTTLHNVLEYFLTVHKELLYLANHGLPIGCYGRYRVLLETYCIVKYFIKHQDCIFRFYDHQIIRDYITTDECGGNIRPETRILFCHVKMKYINEFDNFKRPYGWAGRYINNYMTISEIMQIAMDNSEELLGIKQNYTFLSEYAHVSSFAINSQKALTAGHITQILVPSNELSFYMMQIYMKFLLAKTSYKDKPIAYIQPLLNIFQDTLFNKQKI